MTFRTFPIFAVLGFGSLLGAIALAIEEPGTTPGAANLAETPAITPLSSGVTTDSPTRSIKIADGFAMEGGVTYVITEGRPRQLSQQTRLAEGLSANVDGSITLKDGTKMKLQEGQMVTIEGQVTTAPTEIFRAKDAPARGTPSDGSASGLTTPGASSGSSLGTGSNSTLGTSNTLSPSTTTPANTSSAQPGNATVAP